MAKVSRPLKVHYTISGKTFLVDENTPMHVYNKVAFEGSYGFSLNAVINDEMDVIEEEVFCEINGEYYRTLLTDEEYWKAIRG